MITHLRGTLVSKQIGAAVIDVSGVGYEIAISLQCFENLPAIGQETELPTYLQVREDSLTLFGFTSLLERQMFLNLISISGIGPKMAMNILSGRNVDEIRIYVIEENIGALTSIPGIGRKTAERIVIELRDKLSKISVNDIMNQKDWKKDLRSEALLALVSLGYSRPQAEIAMKKAIEEREGEFSKVEELIRAALSRFS